MGMTGPTGSAGIYVYRQDAASGALSLLHTAGGVLNPSFLALDPRRRWLFSVNEALEHDGQPTGAASSFAIDPATGGLRFLSRQHTGGGNPCHLCPDPSGRFLLVANHEEGRVSVLRIDAEGRLGALTDVHQHEPTDPTGRRTPHAHFVTPDPTGRFILASDTGVDRVYVYRLDPATGRLPLNDPPWGETHAGAGPRHLAFHPSGRYVYANGEADMTLTPFAFDAERGALTPLPAASTLPEGESSGSALSTAQVQVHPSGRFVYVSNRGHDSIAVFAVDEGTGRVRRVANESTRGHTPRNFSLDPAGRFLYAANQNSDTVVCFRVDAHTGRLTPTGESTAVAAPTCVLFAGSARGPRGAAGAGGAGGAGGPAGQGGVR
jgi:6-phosphogluconolactonase